MRVLKSTLGFSLLGLMLAGQGVEIHRSPGSSAAGSLDDGRDKLLALTLELGQQHLGLDQKLETVFGKVGIARRTNQRIAAGSLINTWRSKRSLGISVAQRSAIGFSTMVR